MIDIVNQINATHREIGNQAVATGEERSLLPRRAYDAPIEDVRDACTDPCHTWGPVIQTAWGTGDDDVAAAVFSADPVDGFPPGTPVGPPSSISWHGMVHFLVAGVAFLALIAACFVFARRFAAAGRRGWAAFSTTTGALFLADPHRLTRTG
ncbi:DUF998 domain-containing protein [Nonomuraea sp. NPDC048916]|uniref:DUF998 domain-containing protein n=1 Tax=Nonomuraea sp. NPDC048916 TaxID=3154232 RepID=UPI0033C04C24